MTSRFRGRDASDPVRVTVVLILAFSPSMLVFLAWQEGELLAGLLQFLQTRSEIVLFASGVLLGAVLGTRWRPAVPEPQQNDHTGGWRRASTDPPAVTLGRSSGHPVPTGTVPLTRTVRCRRHP